MKLTTWNIEHFSDLLPVDATGQARLDAIRDEIHDINPDILCVVEAPGDLPSLRDWVHSASGLAGQYIVATIEGTDAALGLNPGNARAALHELYAMQGNDRTGNQWIWFLVKDGLFQESGARVLNPAVWQDLTKQPTWPVHDWGNTSAKRHSHWRHPQVLTLQIGSVEAEIIGVHLKSKINKKEPFDGPGLKPEYIQEALRSRVRLATEAYDIRRYIERRFQQEESPRIFVCGDMNDGPGRGYFEREFLFFDLVSNIQGDVFFARRFLNHALFDFEDSLRWTTAFRDRVELWSRGQPGNEALPQEAFDATRLQLIDHILFTQSLVGPEASPRVEPNAGLVEHTIHQRINAPLPSKKRTSDHAPVSVTISP